MRLHISLDDDLVAKVDRYAGPRGRSAFVADAVAQIVENLAKLEAFDRAAGSISDTGHEWDEDPAAWVAAQRREDQRRVG